MKDSDITLTCRHCGKEFVFTRAEQNFYELKGFTTPSRCKECRSEKQSATIHRVCAQCGTEIEKEAPVYCNTCLTNVQLEFELKNKQSKKATNAAHTKLQAIESEKSELAELLRQKEQLLAELESKFNNLSQDLEKAVQFHASLEWLEPALNSIKERLDGLEQAQIKNNERMLQTVQKMHELFDNISLWEITKRSLKHLGKVPSPDKAHFDTP